MATTFNFISDSVRNSDGNIDVNLTLDKIRKILVLHIASRELERQTIAEAVDLVFTKNPNVRMNIPALVSETLKNLHVQIENFPILKQRVESFIKENSSPNREDNLPLGTAKGKSKAGSIFRWKDISE
jgi:hypothetical protein